MAATPPVLLPANEAARLRSLHHYDILRALQEEVLDELVVLCATLFELPISYVLLLDAEEGHFKATHGLPPLPPQPRQDLPCAQVIKEAHLIVYHDLASTPQTPLNAQAIQKALAAQARFYAGAPLRMPDQHVIGTLCLVDQRPRQFSDREQQTLEHLADTVSQAVVVRHQCRSKATDGEALWASLSKQVREELQELGALIRYLHMRHGSQVPVPDEVLHLVERRLIDLRAALQMPCD